MKVVDEILIKEITIFVVVCRLNFRNKEGNNDDYKDIETKHL